MNISGIIDTIIWFFTNLPGSFTGLETPDQLAVAAIGFAFFAFFMWFRSPQRKARKGNRKH